MGINLFTDATDIHVGDTLRYAVAVFNGLPGSPRLACDATSIQVFVVTPDGVTNILNLLRTTLLSGQADFYTNAAAYVLRSQDIRPDGTVRATAQVSGLVQNEVPTPAGGFQEVTTEVSQPCIQVAVQCTGGVGETGAIAFTGSVTNCGNNALSGITVTNFVNNGAFAVSFPTNSLLPGQSAAFSGTWIPANPCLPGVATLVAQGTDRLTTRPKTVTSSANLSCTNLLTPSIRVTKACSTQLVGPGQALSYSGSVTNTGNITLTNVVVVSDQPAADTIVFRAASLAPGVGVSFTGSYPAPTNCTSTSTLTVRAASVCGVPVTNSVSSTCPILTAPQIAVSMACPTNLIAPGSVLNYSGFVQNVGRVTLTNIVVLNDRTGTTPVFTTESLAPGAVARFTGSYTAPLNCCLASSTLTATGRDACSGVSARDTATASCPLLTSPSIVVTKVCPTKVLEPGDLLKYSGSVSNAGNITLINVTVSNNLAPAAFLGPITLAPGESVPYTASYVVPVDFCGADTVTARGLDQCTRVAVSNSVTTTCPITTSPRIAVTQNCPSSPTSRGGVHTFTGTVSNPGNVTLTNVFVVNSQPTNNTPVVGPITLAPGASVSFSGSYPAPSVCCEILSTLSARGQDRCAGTLVSATASMLCPLLSTPRLAITRVCPQTAVPVGGVFTFSGTVVNAGDAYLTNVYVRSSQATALLTWRTRSSVALKSTMPQSNSDPGEAADGWRGCPEIKAVRTLSSQPGNNTPVLGPFELAPGESASFSGSYVVAAGSDPFADTVTASGVDTCQGRSVSASANCSGSAPVGPAAKPDIILQTRDGFVGAWFMNGVTMSSAALLNPSNVGDSNWLVAGGGDFNGDGNLDLLFQHTDGTLALWYMQGISLTPPATFLNPAKPSDVNFRAVATGDFNKDGKLDILLQHVDGTMAVWFMNGATLQSSAFIVENPGRGLRVIGAADLNGDGNLDILFQDTNGSLAAWYMNGLSFVSAVLLNPPTPGNDRWRVVGTIDLNRDAKTDLLFQHSTDGTVAVWYMNGITLTQGQLLNPSNPGGTWKIVAPK